MYRNGLPAVCLLWSDLALADCAFIELPVFLNNPDQVAPGDLVSVGALQGNPRSASDATGTGNRDPEWSNLHADSSAKHVSYYIGDKILTVTANFR